MPLIIRAIITGFGYKIGAELGRYVAERVGLSKPNNEAEAKGAEENMPEGLPVEPPGGEDPGPLGA